MMNGVDPHATGDVTDRNGDALDFSDDTQRLISAALVGEISAYPVAGQLPNSSTEVSVASLGPWLRGRENVDLADALGSPIHNSPSQGASIPAAPHIPESERRLARLRELGGDVKYVQARYRITGIVKLIKSEIDSGAARCSQKTIRADLQEAFDAERLAKTAVFGAGLGQRR